MRSYCGTSSRSSTVGPPRRYGRPSPRTTSSSRTFAGLVGGGAPGNVGVLFWGTKPADPKVVAHIAGMLGAPAPVQTTSVRVRGYPAHLGLARDEYAQL